MSPGQVGGESFGRIILGTRLRALNAKNPVAPRHSIMLSSSSCPEHWLDLFPPEICERIALHVKRHPDLICVGQTSPKQRSAVCAALSHKLILESSLDFSAWATLLRHSILELDFVISKQLTGETSPHHVADLLPLLQAPTLRCLALYDSPALLRAVSSSTSRELDVTFSTVNGFDAFFASVQRFQLSKLSGRCQVGSSGSESPFHAATRQTTMGKIAAACTGLISLELFCFCNRGTTPVWDLLPLLPALRETVVVCTQAPSDQQVLRLRQMDSVLPRSGFFALDFAVRVGSAVVALDSILSIFSAGDVRLLLKCPRLRSLTLLLEYGAEYVLADVVSGLAELERLRVYFGVMREPLSGQNGNPADDSTSHMRGRWHGWCTGLRSWWISQ